MKARIAAFCAAALLAGPTVSATSFALLLEGGIQGESSDPAFPGGIDIVSVSIESSLEVGSVGRVVLHKGVDKSTPKLIEASARKQFIRRATLVGKADGDLPRDFLKIEFIDVLVTGISQEKPEPGIEPSDAVELQFAAAHFIYHDPGGERTATYLSPLIGGLDSDGDGIPDAVENHYGMDPTVADAHLDLDGNGVSNIGQLRLGFNPASGSSFFRAEVSPIPGDSTGLNVAWESVPGKAYVIDWSPDLTTPFNPFANHTPEGTRASVRLSKTGLHGFFRVRPASE